MYSYHLISGCLKQTPFENVFETDGPDYQAALNKCMQDDRIRSLIDAGYSFVTTDLFNVFVEYRSVIMCQSICPIDEIPF